MNGHRVSFAWIDLGGFNTVNSHHGVGSYEPSMMYLIGKTFDTRSIIRRLGAM